MRAQPSEGRLASPRATALGAALALAAAGCAGTRSFTIPPVDAAGFEGGRRIPASVGLHFPSGVAGRVATQEVKGPEGETRYVLPVGEAVVETFATLAPRLFEKATRVGMGGAAPPGSGLDGLLEVDLGDVGVSLPTVMQTGTCQVSVRQTFTLRDARGSQVARWEANGTGDVPRTALVTCGGEAAARALEENAAVLVRGLQTDPAVRSWVGKLGRTWDPPGSDREVRRTWSPESGEGEGGPEPLAPRTFGVYGGGGGTWPVSSQGQLPSAQGGAALALGGTWRPEHWMTLEAQAQYLGSSYSAAAAVRPPGYTSFAAQLDLNQTMLSLLVRLGWPIGIVEPWAGGGPVFDFGLLSWPAASTSGLPTTVSSSAFGVGAVAAVGVDVAVGRNVVLGARWSWLWCQLDFGSLSNGRAPVGGQSLLVAGGYAWP
jgi:hypothetical protein